MKRRFLYLRKNLWKFVNMIKAAGISFILAVFYVIMAVDYSTETEGRNIL